MPKGPLSKPTRPLKDSRDKGHNSDDRTRQEIKDVQAAVRQGTAEIVAKLEEVRSAVTTAPGISQCGSVSAVHGRRFKTMSNIAVPKLLDTEKIELSIMPRKADGHVDTAASPTWSSSDTSQGEVIPGTEAFEFVDVNNGDEVVTCPGNFRCVATTPLTSGTYTVTSTLAGYEDEVFGPIEYAAGVARKQNGSVGSPVSDL